MLNSIMTAYSSSMAELTAAQLLACTAASLALGLVCAVIYMYHNHYNKTFVLTLALLPAMVQMVILLVNGNLGTGVAVAGAFSLVRFRSLPGSAREIGSIFLAMAVGLATGMGFIGIAVLFVLVLGGVTVVLESTHFGEEKTSEKSLKVTIPETLEYEEVFSDIFARDAESVSLTRVKTSNMGSLFELEYRIRLKETVSEKAFLDELRCRNGNLPLQLARVATLREDQL